MMDSEQTDSRPFSEGNEGNPLILSPRWRSVETWRAWARLLRMRIRWWSTGHLVATVIAGLVFAGSLWIIARELRGFEYAEVWAYLQDLPLSYVLVALGLTVLTFVVLTGYDALALRYVGASLSVRRLTFSAFVGYAVSQAIGNPILTGGSVRYRLYSLWGLSPTEVAKAILFAGVSFWLGFCTLVSVVLLVDPLSLAEAVDFPIAAGWIGLVCLLPVAAYAGGTLLRTDPVELWGWALDIPPPWMLPIQVALAAGDLLLASSVVFVLLPPNISITLSHLLVAYLIALWAGLLSHVPGGLGVFESIMLLLLTPEIPAPTVLGALLAYRGIFHLLPLTVAVLAFGAFEMRRGMRQLSESEQRTG